MSVWKRLRFPQRTSRRILKGNGTEKMSHPRLISRFGLPALSASLLVALLGVLLGSAHPTQAALVEGGKGPQLLIGRDDDNIDNFAIQAGAAANQSLNRTDILEGGKDGPIVRSQLERDGLARLRRGDRGARDR